MVLQLLKVGKVNFDDPEAVRHRINFDNLTQGQDYTYAVAGVSPLGVGELSATATITVDSAEPVYVNKKMGFYYEVDYVNKNPSSSYNHIITASYNSRNFKVAEPNMRAHAYLFVAAGDKVKEHGMHINQYKTTKYLEQLSENCK